MIINSSKNAKIKKLKALKTKKGRKEHGLYCIEGVNILKDLSSRVSIDELFIKESSYTRLAFLEKKLNCRATLVVDRVFDSVCDTVSPNGVLATSFIKENNEITGDTIALLCGISDAGNMGTIFRTAAAKGIETLLLYGDCVDIYSPKVIRAGMGGTFQVNARKVFLDDIKRLIDDYKLIALDSNGKSIYDYKRNGKIIIAVGSEAHGIPDEVLKLSDETISLPMSNNIESLNAAVSISIAFYML